MKALIITPACNEENHLPELINSMIHQSVLPIEWIIVDDGSTDNTSNVIQKAAVNYSWISYLRKEKTGDRSPGKSVIETFYFGFYNRKNLEYDVVMKLDADLVLPPDYIRTVLAQFKLNDKIGICGGVCVMQEGEKYILEKETNLDHIRGAIKSYKKLCFNEIGGLLKEMGWDTVDEHSARFHGWIVKVMPELKVVHQRSTHQEYGFVKAAFRNGRMLYSIRMDVGLLLTNCFKKIYRKPYLVLGMAMLFGYLRAFFQRDKKIVDPDLGRFIRQYRYKQIVKKYIRN